MPAKKMTNKWLYPNCVRAQPCTEEREVSPGLPKWRAGRTHLRASSQVGRPVARIEVRDRRDHAWSNKGRMALEGVRSLFEDRLARGRGGSVGFEVGGAAGGSLRGRDGVVRLVRAGRRRARAFPSSSEIPLRPVLPDGSLLDTLVSPCLARRRDSLGDLLRVCKLDLVLRYVCERVRASRGGCGVAVEVAAFELVRVDVHLGGREGVVSAFEGESESMHGEFGGEVDSIER